MTTRTALSFPSLIRTDSAPQGRLCDAAAELVFHHQPKTAGTSLRQALARLFAREEICPAEIDDELAQLTPEERAQYRFYAGHFRYDVIERLFPDALWITMLRHPVNRVVSQYYNLHDTSRLNSEWRKRAALRPEVSEFLGQVSRMTLEQFVFSDHPRALDHIVNRQTRYLVPRDQRVLAMPEWDEEMLAQAKQNLRERFVFVGVLEEFDLSLQLLAITFGEPSLVTIESPRANVNRLGKSGHQYELTPEIRDRLESMNRMDIELWNFAKSLVQERLLAFEAALLESDYDLRAEVSPERIPRFSAPARPNAVAEKVSRVLRRVLPFERLERPLRAPATDAGAEHAAVEAGGQSEDADAIVRVGAGVEPLRMKTHGTGDPVLSSTLIGTGVWEPTLTHIMRELFAQCRCFVDVGANIGYFALLADRLAPPGVRVHAFEPEARCADLLALNVERNGAASVSIVRAAVAERQGSATLHCSSINPGDNRFHSTGCDRATQKVKTVALDDYFAAVDSPLPDLIKIDAQGAEPSIIAGMRRLIERSAPRIVLEFWPVGFARSGASYEDVIRPLETAGYRFFAVFERERRVMEVAPADLRRWGRGILSRPTCTAGDGPFVDLVCLPRGCEPSRRVRELLTDLRLPMGRDLRFSLEGDADRCIVPMGWSYPAAWGRWSDGHACELIIQPDLEPSQREQGVDLELDCHAYARIGVPIIVDFLINERVALHRTFAVRDPQTVRLSLTREEAQAGRLAVGMRIQNATTPPQRPGLRRREIGLGVHALRLVPHSSAAAERGR
ncbi:MAG: hypothetical protein Kow0022_05250 [Phycisphaerales bacterium]